MADNNAVSFQKVSKNYHNIEALKEISFNVEKGSFFGLLGPNGAGKSTLINAMSGLVTPTSGEIFVNGSHTIRDYRQARKSLGLVPQELISDPFFSIKELLRIQSGYFGLKGKQQQNWTDELLERLSLADKRNAITNELSGGMKRRVLIAMALVHKPEVIVLDEPTAGVDVDLRKTLWEFTKELHQQGHTIILTTHYLEEAEALCEKVAILQSGELKALERVTDLVSKHAFRYVRVSLVANEQNNDYNQLDKNLKERVDSHSATEIVFKIEKELSLNKFSQWLSICKFKIKDISTRDATLEEAFLDLTGAKK